MLGFLLKILYLCGRIYNKLKYYNLKNGNQERN